ncbi:FMN-binding protein, partial [Streptomyces nanshensis]
AVRLPDGNARDREIAASAVPQLTREALAAQSARIDAVSGATYTSDGYISSLQSALDRSHG